MYTSDSLNCLSLFVLANYPWFMISFSLVDYFFVPLPLGIDDRRCSLVHDSMHIVITTLLLIIIEKKHILFKESISGRAV